MTGSTSALRPRRRWGCCWSRRPRLRRPKGMPQLDFGNPLTISPGRLGRGHLPRALSRCSRIRACRASPRVLEARETRIEGDLEAARAAKAAGRQRRRRVTTRDKARRAPTRRPRSTRRSQQAKKEAAARSAALQRQPGRAVRSRRAADRRAARNTAMGALRAGGDRYGDGGGGSPRPAAVRTAPRDRGRGRRGTRCAGPSLRAQHA